MKKSAKSNMLGIKAVAQRSGLSEHIIRIWERRYDAVTPSRTETNRRLYSEADVIRLELLNKAVHLGHRIGDIANLSTAKLEKLVEKSKSDVTRTQLAPAGTGPEYIEQALDAIIRYDSELLSAILSRADVDLGQARALELFIMPLMERIGALWRKGDLRIANEHMATAVVTNHVGSVLANFRYAGNAPAIVIATPLGQLHEGGALAVGVVSALAGWRPIYLGANLPANEIANAAMKSKSRAIALSLIFPSDDPGLPPELARLRRALPDRCSIIIGGRMADAYLPAINAIGAVYISDMSDLRLQLDTIRAKNQ